MSLEINLRCTCGAVTGVAAGVDPARGNRLVCMCDDCQAYARWLGRADVILDPSGGTEVFQLTPAQLRFTGGEAHLRCVRLTAKGLMRWYAGCCNTPVANTLASPKIPFVGVPVLFMSGLSASGEAELGPLLARIHGRFGRPPLPPGSHLRAPLRLILRSIRQLLRGLITGAHTPSPVFDGTGQPRVEPTVLAHAEREALSRAVD